jgi:hypothetical protein
MTTKPAHIIATDSPKQPALKNTVKPEKKHKKKLSDAKVKVIRDSFTMPQNDYALITELKEKALKGGMHVKKSELLRAGLRLLAKSNAIQFKRAVDTLEKIKTGRPKSD